MEIKGCRFFVNEYNIEAKRPILYSSRPIIADIMYISNKEKLVPIVPLQTSFIFAFFVQ